MPLSEPKDRLRLAQQMEQARREQRLHEVRRGRTHGLRALLTDLRGGAQERVPTGRVVFEPGGATTQLAHMRGEQGRAVVDAHDALAQAHLEPLAHRAVRHSVVRPRHTEMAVRLDHRTRPGRQFPRRGGQRDERRLFTLLERLPGTFPGRAMEALPGDVARPLHRLCTHLAQAREAASTQEAFTQEAFTRVGDATLNTRFVFRVAHARRINQTAVGARQFAVGAIHPRFTRGS
jgi:hypothetical protein